MIINTQCYSYKLAVLILMKLEFSRQISEKYPNIKFYKNAYNGSRVFPCGQTGKQSDGQTDVTKLIVTFRNFANMPKNLYALCVCVCVTATV